MRALVADDVVDGVSSERDASAVTVHGRPVRFSLASLDDADFDAEGRDRGCALLRVRAFSLNYRDRSIVVPPSDSAGGRRVVGSEFAAEVIDIGREVSRIRVGQRVVGEMAWPSNGISGAPGGVPTNAASAELLRLPEGKLAVIPEEMPDEVAAAFVLGAQTAFSMVRRLELRPGYHVLVTAATSNTSLFAIAALRTVGAIPVAMTTRVDATERLLEHGAERVICVSDPAGFEEVREAAQAVGGFDGVIDPFADVYLSRALPTLGFFGRYVTCGMSYDSLFALDEPRGPATSEMVGGLIVKNLQIIGNCLGLPQDLEEAFEQWRRGRLPVVIDSVHRGEVFPFIQRTFLARDRLGKTVYVYE